MKKLNENETQKEKDLRGNVKEDQQRRFNIIGVCEE